MEWSNSKKTHQHGVNYKQFPQWKLPGIGNNKIRKLSKDVRAIIIWYELIKIKANDYLIHQSLC